MSPDGGHFAPGGARRNARPYCERVIMSSTDKERTLYGRKWNNIHEGYFSDPAVAAPFIDAISSAMRESHPTVVADLGGGTGFILAVLLERGENGSALFVDVDSSPEQLAQAVDPRINCIPCSIPETRRELLVSPEGTLLLCMRSVLHYFGRSGLRPVLSHLRSLMCAGEYLVHQTASFEDVRGQEILNTIYEGMDTGKWYPTLEELALSMRDEGWEVVSVEPAPSLALSMIELAERYGMTAKALSAIGLEIERKYGSTPGVFMPCEQGFTTYLDYHILKCRAA